MVKKIIWDTIPLIDCNWKVRKHDFTTYYHSRNWICWSYFHGQLLVSPNNEWIVDNGWEWQPIGSVTTWNIKEWMDNCWESEDGESKKTLWWGKSDWIDPICWLSDTKIGVTGRIEFNDREEETLLEGWIFRILDVISGRLLKEFNISYGNLFFDKYLFCASKEKGFLVYDVNNGEILFEEASVRPWVYHKKSQEFLDCGLNELIAIKLIEEAFQ